MITKNALITLIALANFAILSGCSAKFESVGEPIDFKLKNLNPPTAPGANTVLEGKWAIGCTAMPGMALVADVEFNGDTYVKNIKLYTDPACVNLMNESQEKGTFTLPAAGQFNSRANDGTLQFDIFSIEDGVLYFGDQAGDTVDARPARLNKALGLKKI